MYETWYKMTTMLQSGLDISRVITHRFDVRDFEEGFRAMNSGGSERGGPGLAERLKNRRTR